MWLSALACLGSALWLSVCAGNALVWVGDRAGRRAALHGDLGSALSLSMWVRFVPLKHFAIPPLWRQLGHLVLCLVLKTLIVRFKDID